MSNQPLATLPLVVAVAGLVACDSGTEPGPQPAAIELEAPVDVLPAGQTATLEAAVVDDAGQPIPNPSVQFSTSNQTIATVSQTGVVAGVGEGLATFTATAGTASDDASIYIFDVDDLCETGLGLVPGEPVRASLQQGDCALDDGSFIDFWYFELAQRSDVTIDMASDAFDAYLFLLEGVETIAQDDNGGEGFNARIDTTLDAGFYWVGANQWDNEPPGTYTVLLTVDATAASPAAAAWPAAPAPTAAAPAAARRPGAARAMPAPLRPVKSRIDR